MTGCDRISNLERSIKTHQPKLQHNSFEGISTGQVVFQFSFSFPLLVLLVLLVLVFFLVLALLLFVFVLLVFLFFLSLLGRLVQLVLRVQVVLRNFCKQGQRSTDDRVARRAHGLPSMCIFATPTLQSLSCLKVSVSNLAFFFFFKNNLLVGRTCCDRMHSEQPMFSLVCTEGRSLA